MQFEREMLRLIPLAHVRPDLGLGELADAAAAAVPAPRSDESPSAFRFYYHGFMRPIARARDRVVIRLALSRAVAPACADATAFIGANTTPSNRTVKGFAVGFGLLIVAFEFEYADHERGSWRPLAPALKTGMGNVLLQTPVPIFGFQPYFTTGGGVYRETLGRPRRPSLGTNVGGGVKVSLAGPLRLRVDYRVFRLGSGALYSPAHRLYAGLNLSF